MDGNAVLGVLYATVNLKALAEQTTDSVKIGRTGSCFVYDRTGLLLMHPNRKYIGDEDGKLDWVRRILEQRDGHLRYIWDGKEKMVYFRAIPSMDWSVLVSVERAEIFAPAAALLRGNLLLMLGIGLVVGLMIFFVARNIAGALDLGSRFVARVAEGHFEIDGTQRHSMEKSAARPDEIGGLFRGVGGMVENLKRLFAESEQKTLEAHAATEEARKAMREAEDARKAAEGARREGMLTAAGQLEEVAAVLSSTSARLSAQIEQSDRGAAESASRLSEAATAMNEMNATVQEVARNAGS
ncbi:methyl-accepting chemotaxis protein, partial [uncultured Desulfovibrio sp.]|uniref:methyl-accepting chemotaxis protein n=1 Tax=uncultured Desulfovibrio sp. TaxID=167968 RepID=UPI00262EF68E